MLFAMYSLTAVPSTTSKCMERFVKIIKTRIIQFDVANCIKEISRKVEDMNATVLYQFILQLFLCILPRYWYSVILILQPLHSLLLHSALSFHISVLRFITDIYVYRFLNFCYTFVTIFPRSKKVSDKISYLYLSKLQYLVDRQCQQTSSLCY